jgi:AhpD family alkylhydroperoxidase
MMFDWGSYRKQIATRISEFGKLSPGSIRGYRELSQAGDAANLLGAKTRELIALAVAVTRQCDGCIAVHTDAALKHGASREEIAEALGVAIAINAGATLIYTSRVMDAIAEHPPV